MAAAESAIGWSDCWISANQTATSSNAPRAPAGFGQTCLTRQGRGFVSAVTGRNVPFHANAHHPETSELQPTELSLFGPRRNMSVPLPAGISRSSSISPSAILHQQAHAAGLLVSRAPKLPGPGSPSPKASQWIVAAQPCRWTCPRGLVQFSRADIPATNGGWRFSACPSRP